MGKVATVWDGEVAGLERGILAAGNRESKIILLTDSKAAIQATKKAVKTGKARTRALASLANEIRERNDLYGLGNTLIGWVKSHIRIAGNERADEMAKKGSEKETGEEITEGGIRQRSREIRKAKRDVPGFLCVAGWDRKIATTYTHLSTKRGNLRCWTHMIGKSRTDVCRGCGDQKETGDHIMFTCPAWEHSRPKR